MSERAAAPAPHLLHVFSTFVPAGPEVRTVKLINALGRQFRHTILAIDGRTSASEGISAEADARVIDAPPRAGTPKTVLALRRVFRVERPDVVLSYNWGAFDAVLAARSMRIANLHHEDGFTSEESAGFKLRRELMRRVILAGVQRVIVPSHRLQQIALERWRLKPEQVTLVPNGVDLAPFAAEQREPALRAELGIPADALVIGAVGHLRPEKNPARLLEALSQVPDSIQAHALLLGDGPERARLEALASEPRLAGRVHLVGHRTDTPRWYRAMDLFALSSDTEQMPVALLEAMASGLPVTSTRVGDVAHMLPDGQAPFLVSLEAGDAAAGLAGAIARLASNPPLRASLGAANRARVQDRYEFSRMLHAYLTLYTGAASR